MSPAITTVVTLLLQVLNLVLPQLGLGPLAPSIIKLADDVLPQIPKLWTALRSGQTKTAEVTASLAAVQAAVAAAKADLSASAGASADAVLAWLDAIDRAAAQALAADTAATEKVDPSTLTEIAELS